MKKKAKKKAKKLGWISIRTWLW